MSSSKKIKYFLYSSEQMNILKSINSQMGKRFLVGHVIVNGTKVPFTELSSTPKSRYTDAKIVAQGDPETMSYTLPIGGN